MCKEGIREYDIGMENKENTQAEKDMNIMWRKSHESECQ